jgi:hypothetical protein
MPEHDRLVRDAEGGGCEMAIEEVEVAVTDAGGDDPNQHLSAQRLIQVELLDRERRMRPSEEGGADAGHGLSPLCAPLAAKSD